MGFGFEDPANPAMGMDSQCADSSYKARPELKGDFAMY